MLCLYARISKLQYNVKITERTKRIVEMTENMWKNIQEYHSSQNLPLTVLKDGKIVRLYKDGREEIIP